jgi:hypothetical protein
VAAVIYVPLHKLKRNHNRNTCIGKYTKKNLNKKMAGSRAVLWRIPKFGGMDVNLHGTVL